MDGSPQVSYFSPIVSIWEMSFQKKPHSPIYTEATHWKGPHFSVSQAFPTILSFYCLIFAVTDTLLSQAVVAHNFKPSTLEAEIGGYL